MKNHCDLPIDNRQLHTTMGRGRVAITSSRGTEKSEEGGGGVREGMEEMAGEQWRPVLISVTCRDFPLPYFLSSLGRVKGTTTFANNGIPLSHANY